jgi:hypothetical protein
MTMLDLPGNISLSLQVMILVLLVLGLPSISGKDANKVTSRHGYYTLIALILHTILIFTIMVPVFLNGVPDIWSLPPLYKFNIVSHAVLGTIAEIGGAVVVGYWLMQSPKKMRCVKMKQWMWPVLIVWVVSLVNGALIHLLNMI